jgi:hypothetical protein
MKKRKSIFGALLLSTVLAGNVFAGDFTGIGVFDFFGNIYTAVLSLAGGSPCEGRQCQTCRPTENRDGEGNCRPTKD